MGVNNIQQLFDRQTESGKNEKTHDETIVNSYVKCMFSLYKVHEKHNPVVLGYFRIMW